MARHIGTTEVAKLIRKQLKKDFKLLYPNTKFSVRSSRGSSIRVRWENGPSREQVEQSVGHFKGATFDGMQDLKNYHDSEFEGEIVSFGNDFLFCERKHTEEHFALCYEWLIATGQYSDNPEDARFVKLEDNGREVTSPDYHNWTGAQHIIFGINELQYDLLSEEIQNPELYRQRCIKEQEQQEAEWERLEEENAAAIAAEEAQIKAEEEEMRTESDELFESIETMLNGNGDFARSTQRTETAQASTETQSEALIKFMYKCSVQAHQALQSGQRGMLAAQLRLKADIMESSMDDQTVLAAIEFCNRAFLFAAEDAGLKK